MKKVGAAFYMLSKALRWHSESKSLSATAATAGGEHLEETLRGSDMEAVR
jgi:hypothetical protein